MLNSLDSKIEIADEWPLKETYGNHGRSWVSKSLQGCPKTAIGAVTLFWEPGKLSIQETIWPVTAKDMHGFFLIIECIGLERYRLGHDWNLDGNFRMFFYQTVTSQLEADFRGVDRQCKRRPAALGPLAVESKKVDAVL